jgi:hypothetical protein
VKESKKRDHKNLNSQKDVIMPAPALRNQMPEDLKSSLPTIEEIEQEMENG